MTDKVLFIGCENYMDTAVKFLQEYKKNYQGRSRYNSVAWYREGAFEAFAWGGNGKQITVKMIETK